MYSTPGRTATPHHKQIPEGPICDFHILIEETPVEDWQKRTKAFTDLVDSIPVGSAYTEGNAWYNSAPILRHLAISVSELLKDPRSTVVKRSCESLTNLFNKCQSDARYLFKDIMPTILSVHAQTVQVIRQAVQNMVLECIPEVPCKMVMPLWMERLKVDKSRTVRDACALYLGQALQSWTEEGYLTEEIWLQVGATLIKSLRDPSPNVRQYAKSALERMQSMQPKCWDQIMYDGPAANDPKLQRWLKSLGGGPDAEELSVASKFSYNADIRVSRSATVSRSSPSKTSRMSEQETVPTSIAISKLPPKKGSGLGPPMRLTPFPQANNTPQKKDGGSPPRPRKSADDNMSRDSIQDLEEASSFPSDLGQAFEKKASVKDQDKEEAQPEKQKEEESKNEVTQPKKQEEEESKNEVTQPKKQEEERPVKEDKKPEKEKVQPEQKGPSSPKVEAKGESQGDIAEDPFIASIEELKNHASKRRSRNSLLMQERFRMSNMGTESVDSDDPNKRSDVENQVPNPSKPAFASPKTPSAAPEHMVIAIRLLRAHKEHVDTIMETLRIEMDTLRDFDKLLEEPGRPTEEEVLDYFESLGMCLDQRSQAGTLLQREMDRISRGEPPSHEE